MGNPTVPTASRSWTILLALAAQLATITVANGYLTDAGLNVWTTDNQRTDDNALGLMIYSESIMGPGIDRERPGLPVREVTFLIEAAIGTDLDTAQQAIHEVIDDIDRCMAAYAKAQAGKPAPSITPMHVADFAIIDRPEGAAVIAMQARIVARYFR
jgi:hypothetical protein